MPNPHLMPKFIQHPFKPRAVTAGLESDDYFSLELSIELAYFIDRLVLQLGLVNLTIFSVTPLDQLLPCVKINATIRNHGDSFLVLKLTASLINPRQGSHLLHYINLKFSALTLRSRRLRSE
jgi:hypothetical protein